MDNRIIPIGALVAAILVAFGINKCEIPADVANVITKTKQVIKHDTVYIPVEKTVVNTKYIDKIRVIRDSLYTLANAVVDTNLGHNLRGKFGAASNYAEAIQNENKLLVEDKNNLVDILSQTTNELWMEKNKPLTKDSVKKFKQGLSASYGVLIGSKPIYQLTYEKPLTPALSLTGGVIWNGKPGVAGGVKIMW